MTSQQPPKMDPKDNRNLIIFMVVSALLYFVYDTYVMRPYENELRAARVEQLKAAQDTAQNPEQTTATPQTPEEYIAATPHISINSDTLTGAITLKGGAIGHLSLNAYREHIDAETPIAVLSPDTKTTGRTIGYGWVSNADTLDLPDHTTLWSAKTGTALTPETPVHLTWSNTQGLTFERIITLDDSYLITVEQRVTNTSTDSHSLHPYGLIKQRGLPKDFMSNMVSHEGPIGYISNGLEKYNYKKLRKKRSNTIRSTEGWIGITDKYWLTALMPEQGKSAHYRFTYEGTPPRKKEADTGMYQTDFTGQRITIGPGQTESAVSHAFVGPKKVIMLKEYSKKLGTPKLDLSVDFGMFWFFTIPFFYCLHYLSAMIGNMGFAIIALTILIRLAASPLTYASYKSFAKMKKVMPHVNALKEKYGETDKAKLQAEMMSLYQKEGVNPAAGCVPMLLQIPIFFAFYKILLITIELRHAPFIGWIKDLSAADPTNLFTLFGLIPWTPPSFLAMGIWPCLMFVAMLIQQSLNPPPTDKLQRDIMRFFPVVMTFVMAQFASGLVIYWTISAFFGNVQQIVIMRKMGVPIHLFGERHDTHDANDTQESSPKKAAQAVKAEPTPTGPIKPPKPRRKKKK